MAFTGFSLKKFAHDTKGSVAIIFALTAIPALAITSVAIDYGYASKQKAEAQATNDAAALAAAAVLARGGNEEKATKAFRAYFESAPKLTGTPDISFTNSNNTATVTAKYSGSAPRLAGGFFGTNATNYTVSSSAQANLVNLPVTLFNDSGEIWGDPQFRVAEAQRYGALACREDGNWYSLLSDSKFQMNGTCYLGITGWDFAKLWNPSVDLSTVDYYNGEYFLKGLTFTIDNHVVEIMTTTAPNNSENNPENKWNGIGSILSMWDGSIKIDGQLYTPSQYQTVSYLNGAVIGKPLNNTNLFDGTQCAGYDPYSSPYNSVCGQKSYWPDWISTNKNYMYSIKSGSYTINVFYRFDGMMVQLWANNAGKCGAPDGMWGKMLIGDNTYWNSNQYLMASATAKSPAFNNPSDCQTSIVRNVRLVK